MSYKLYTDKQEIFECKISLQGASLREATSRVIVKTDKLNLMFEGTIDNYGNCKIPIKKLSGLLGEGDKGTIKLEVIAEDTYFQPWKSAFVVDRSRRMTVEVKQQSKSLRKNSKPKISVSEVKSKPKIKRVKSSSISKVVNMLYEKGINVKTIYNSKDKVLPILAEYSTSIGYQKGMKNFIKEVVLGLKKKGRR